MNLSKFHRNIYTNRETSIEHLPRYLKSIERPNILIKRDDLLSLTAGGSKTWKFNSTVYLFF